MTFDAKDLPDTRTAKVVCKADRFQLLALAREYVASHSLATMAEAIEAVRKGWGQQ